MKKQEITELVNKNIVMLFLPGEETTTLARDKNKKNYWFYVFYVR